MSQEPLDPRCSEFYGPVALARDGRGELPEPWKYAIEYALVNGKRKDGERFSGVLFRQLNSWKLLASRSVSSLSVRIVPLDPKSQTGLSPTVNPQDSKQTWAKYILYSRDSERTLP